MNKSETAVLDYLTRTCIPGSGQTLGKVARFGLGDNTYQGRRDALSVLRALKRRGLIDYHGFNKVWYPIM